MDFGYALNALREGCKVARSGWNGKGMFLELVDSWGSHSWEMKDGSDAKMLPFILMKTANPCDPPEVVPWLASQTDLLSNDWEIVK